MGVRSVVPRMIWVIAPTMHHVYWFIKDFDLPRLRVRHVIDSSHVAGINFDEAVFVYSPEGCTLPIEVIKYLYWKRAKFVLVDDLVDKEDLLKCLSSL